MASQDSDAAEMKRLINYDDESGEEEQDESMDSGDSDEEGEQESDPDIESASDSESVEEAVAATKSKLKKRTLKDRLAEEQETRDKEKRMRLGDDAPRDIDDFERLLVANQD